MKHIALSMGLAPLAYVQALASPFVALGVVLLILWLLTRMILLSRSDLSYVLPATAVGYVLTAIFAVAFLKESLSPYRWAGTLLIFAGVALVSSDPQGLNTAKQTTGD
jgi:drug/metabolite transporter (DMT)-like permease